MKKIKVAVLGATGAVGQRFVQLLENHPWFEVTALCASEKSAGKTYEEAVNWKVSSTIPSYARSLKVRLCKPNTGAKIAFSGLDFSVAGKIEENFANAGYCVVSNSKNHRMDSDVPLIVPEVNSDHLALIKHQKSYKKKGGFIVTNPNCTTIGLAMALAPLYKNFGIQKVAVTSMQALSGAGYPGVPSSDINDNIIPYIENEEEKVEIETKKLLGTLSNGQVEFSPLKISASCNRVAVSDGHTESVEVELTKNVSLDEIVSVLKSFKGLPQKLKLPSAPKHPIIYHHQENRPQPALDRNLENSMAVSVGRVRKSEVFDVKFTLLVHNTIRGAAGAAILNAELLKAKHLI